MRTKHFTWCIAFMVCAIGLTKRTQAQTAQDVISECVGFLRTGTMPAGFTKRVVNFEFSLLMPGTSVVISKSPGTFSLDSALVAKAGTKSYFLNTKTAAQFLSTVGSNNTGNTFLAKSTYSSALTATSSKFTFTFNNSFTFSVPTPITLDNTLTVVNTNSTAVGGLTAKDFVLYGTGTAGTRKVPFMMLVSQRFN